MQLQLPTTYLHQSVLGKEKVKLSHPGFGGILNPREALSGGSAELILIFVKAGLCFFSLRQVQRQ